MQDTAELGKKMSFISTFELVQQTPMIHFQHDEEGATLRGSEVKPKLDRFIIKQLGGEKEFKEKHPDWLIGSGEHMALDYKMRIVAHGSPDTSTEAIDACKAIDKCGKAKCKGLWPDVTIGKSYFGNSVKLERDWSNDRKKMLVSEKYKESVFYNSAIEFVIVCRNSKLKETIDNNIVAFFLLNNFGTRQNKGFGSFVIDKKDNIRLNYNSEQVIREFSEICEKTAYYAYSIDYSKKNSIDYLQEIFLLYSLMKTGVNYGGQYHRSFIYQYFYGTPYKEKFGAKIKNEKAWMKQSAIAPIRGKEVNSSKHEHLKFDKDETIEPKYVRALLGICDGIDYLLEPLNNQWNKQRISISGAELGEDRKPVISRYKSPITFKVADKKIFIIVYEPHPKILGAEFIFDGHKIQIPSETEFSMKHFIDQYILYINGDKSVSNFYTSVDGYTALKAGKQGLSITKVGENDE